MSCQRKEIPTIEISTTKTITFENKVVANFIYQDKTTFESPAKVKFRGGFSRQFEKHSFTIELDSAFTIADLQASKDWILNASYIDKTFLRHKVSFDLFREMNSINVAPQCAYVNVELNQQPQGLYVAMQQINESTLGLDEEGAMLFKEPLIFYQERLDSIDPVLNYYEQKYPAFTNKDYSSNLEHLKQFLFDSEDEVFADSIDYWVDIDNIIDWHLILLLTNNGDGILKNFYLYKLNEETPFRIAIWDYDHTFCRDGDNEYNDLSQELNWRKNILLERLTEGNVNGYLDKLKARWNDLRAQGVISTKNLSSEMNKNRLVFEWEIANNAKIWPLDSHWYFDDNTFQEEYKLMLDCIKKRIPQMNEYLKEL